MFTRHINGQRVEIDLIARGGWFTFAAPAYGIEQTGQDKAAAYAEFEGRLERATARPARRPRLPAALSRGRR